MGRAARAIIIENNQILIMQRDKHGSQYSTLVGGRANEDEAIEQTLAREIKEETGLDITKHRMVFIEEHPAPYNEQYIFLCEVAPHESIAIQTTSEEGMMNRVGINLHTPVWVPLSVFPRLSFRTPQLQQAITEALKNGFPSQPVKL